MSKESTAQGRFEGFVPCVCFYSAQTPANILFLIKMAADHNLGSALKWFKRL